MARPLLWALFVAAVLLFSAPSAFSASSELRSGSEARVAVDDSLSVRVSVGAPADVAHQLMLWIIGEVKAGHWSAADPKNTENDWKQNTLAVGVTTGAGGGTKIYIGTNKGKNLNGMPDKVTKPGSTKGTSVLSLILAQAKKLDSSVVSVNWANTAFDASKEGGHAERRVAKAIDTAGATVAAIISNRKTCPSCVTFFTKTYKSGAAKSNVFWTPNQFDPNAGTNPKNAMPADSSESSKPTAAAGSKKRPPPAGGGSKKPAKKPRTF